MNSLSGCGHGLFGAYLEIFFLGTLVTSAVSSSPWAKLPCDYRTCGLPRSPFVRDRLNLKTLFLKQQETEVKFEAINVSDRSSVVTSQEFGGCLSVLLPLPAWGSRKDSQPDVFQEPLSGSSLEFPILGPKKRHFPGLRWLAIFPAKPSADPGHLKPDQQLVPTAGLSQC